MTGLPSRYAVSMATGTFTMMRVGSICFGSQRQRSMFAAIWDARCAAGTFSMRSVSRVSWPLAGRLLRV
jgi:hypothetical protein